jgi:cobalt-zinc-cadmium efflux system outer membrane protein
MIRELIYLLVCSFLPALGLHAEHSIAGDESGAHLPALSLDALTRTALAENSACKAAQANWQAMKARVPQAAAWEDLSVSFQGRAGRFVDVPANAFTDNQLTIEQKVPLNGKNISRARGATADAVVAYEQLRRAELDVRANVAAAYWRLANAYAQLDLNRQNETLLHEAAGLSRARYEAGRQTQADVLTATIELARLVEARADLERARAEAQSALNVLLDRPARAPLGLPPALTADTSPALPLPSQKQLEALALAYRPEMRIAQKRIDAAQARLELSRRAWMPDPALRVSGQQYNDTSQAVNEVDVGIAFTVPWLNAGKYRAQDREARAGLTQKIAELAQLRTETLGRVQDALIKVQTLHHHFEVYRDEILPLARQTVAATRSGYENAQSNFADLIAAERTLRDAAAESLNHLADYEAALAELAAVVGANFDSLPSPQ